MQVWFAKNRALISYDADLVAGDEESDRAVLVSESEACVVEVTEAVRVGRRSARDPYCGGDWP